MQLIAFGIPNIYAEIGSDINGIGLSEVEMGSIIPMITEVGKISLSVDGLGTETSVGTIQVEKPSGATVRKAYLVAATSGFSNTKLSSGDVSIDGVEITWDIETPSSISSYNYWADITSIVKSKIDTSAAGRIDITVSEKISDDIDGTILAVIFDDPSQTINTIVLLFGAQNVLGDIFAISFADPIDKSDAKMALDLSLGISYEFQPATPPQFSIINVNSQRLTSSAGGHDDGAGGNGALLTVGGLDDTNTNPIDPLETESGNTRYDDELYDLVPFVDNGDMQLNVFTLNPSTDDNIFFAALFLGSTTAIVGKGIVLGPTMDSNPIGTEHTVTAVVQDDLGNPVEEVEVTIEITDGPHTGLKFLESTDSNGKVSFTYTGDSEGTDTIIAYFMENQETIYSNSVEKIWVPEFVIPEIPFGTLSILSSLFGAYILKKILENK
jgi:hypothetical protein